MKVVDYGVQNALHYTIPPLFASPLSFPSPVWGLVSLTLSFYCSTILIRMIHSRRQKARTNFFLAGCTSERKSDVYKVILQHSSDLFAFREAYYKRLTNPSIDRLLLIVTSDNPHVHSRFLSF